jgi:hypothetical protein
VAGIFNDFAECFMGINKTTVLFIMQTLSSRLQAGTI